MLLPQVKLLLYLLQTTFTADATVEHIRRAQVSFNIVAKNKSIFAYCPKRIRAGVTAQTGAVLFQIRTLLRSLERLGERFELPAERRLQHLEGQLLRFSLGSLENPLFGAGSVQEVLEGLGTLLSSISQASGEISDRLGLRFFAHVDASQRTQSS